MYHIRIDTSSENPILEYLASISKRILVSEEAAESGVHIHIVIETDVPEQTIRNHIRSEGFIGNKSYSISKIRDLIKTLAYILKDNNVIMVSFEEDVMKEATAYDIKVKEDIKKKKNILQGIEEHAKENTKDLSSLELRSWVINAVSYYQKNEILFREFQVIAQVQTLYLKHSHRGHSELTNRIIDKLTKF